MKAKTKILVSSIAAMMTFSAVAVGGTYSLFTSKDGADIAVTAGKVQVKAAIKGVKATSGEWDETGAEYKAKDVTASGKFANGGSWSVDGGSVSLERLTPMDKLEFSIEVENLSNVAVKYRTKVIISENDGLFEGLDLKVDNDYIYGQKSSSWSSLEPEESLSKNSYDVSIELPEYVRNEFQDKKAKIQFAIEAVQGNAHVEDDKNVWDGTYLSDVTAENQQRPEGFVVDPTTRTITIKDAESFAYLGQYNMNAFDFGGIADIGTGVDAGYGRDYYYSWDWTVKLATDIDLDNHEWTPINFGTNGIPSYKAFDGCGHSISNLKVTSNTLKSVGLFGTSANAIISNLMIGNAEINGTVAEGNAGVLSGINNGHSKNITVKRASVSGTKYVGGITGYGYAGFEGCKIFESNITNTGYKDVGGIVGFACEAHAVIDNRVYGVTLNNTSSSTEKNIGAIVGRWNYPQTINNAGTKLNFYGNETNTSYDLIGAVANGTMPVQPTKN